MRRRRRHLDRVPRTVRHPLRRERGRRGTLTRGEVRPLRPASYGRAGIGSLSSFQSIAGQTARAHERQLGAAGPCEDGRRAPVQLPRGVAAVVNERGYGCGASVIGVGHVACAASTLTIDPAVFVVVGPAPARYART
jgi:hypothetical protein